MRNGIACAGNWIVDIVQSIDIWPQKSDLVRIRHEVSGVGGGAANASLTLPLSNRPRYAVGLIGPRCPCQALPDRLCYGKSRHARWLKQSRRSSTPRILK